jgi:hypothetical protein
MNGEPGNRTQPAQAGPSRFIKPLALPHAGDSPKALGGAAVASSKLAAAPFVFVLGPPSRPANSPHGILQSANEKTPLKTLMGSQRGVVAPSPVSCPLSRSGYFVEGQIKNPLPTRFGNTKRGGFKQPYGAL